MFTCHNTWSVYLGREAPKVLLQLSGKGAADILLTLAPSVLAVLVVVSEEEYSFPPISTVAPTVPRARQYQQGRQNAPDHNTGGTLFIMALLSVADTVYS